MSNVFLTADLHLGHKGVVTFDGVHGTKLRPWDNVEEMNEALVERWNAKVKPGDKTYVLGDVALSKRWLELLLRMNGKKILVKGNHDQEELKEYVKYFSDVRAIQKKGDFLLSHVPIHPMSLTRWSKGNIHGHLHDGRVLLEDGSIDKRYICVSVEHTNFAPISLDEVERYR
jgi:calcineurin-like phosphoesterase family protein